MRLILTIILVLMSTCAHAAERLELSCDNVERIDILEAPGSTWGIETEDGLYYTIYAFIASNYKTPFSRTLEKSVAFRPCYPGSDTRISYHDIRLESSGKLITSDTLLETQYGLYAVAISRKKKQDAFDIAKQICPEKVPTTMLTPDGKRHPIE